MKLSHEEHTALWDGVFDSFKEDERPEGAITAHEFADKVGCAWTTARDRLKEMVKEGKLKTAQLRIPAQDGRVRLQWVYWPVD